MVDIVVITRKENEGAAVMYRRFTKHFRSSGVQTSVKQKRFHERKVSKNVRKKDCINRLAQRDKYEEAYRLGKISTS